MTKKQVMLALLLLLDLFKAIGVDGASLFFLLTQSKSEPVVGMQLNCSPSFSIYEKKRSNGKKKTLPSSLCSAFSLLTHLISNIASLLRSSWLGALLAIFFMMSVVIILMNVLIAQLSLTYEMVQEESLLSFSVLRMQSVATIEWQSRFKYWVGT